MIRSGSGAPGGSIGAGAIGGVVGNDAGGVALGGDGRGVCWLLDRGLKLSGLLKNSTGTCVESSGNSCGFRWNKLGFRI